MQNRTLTVQVPPDAAKAYEMASPEDRRRIDDALGRKLRELMKTLPPPGGPPAEATQAARWRPNAEIHPDVLKIGGLVPPDVDARAEYRDHLMKKHQ